MDDKRKPSINTRPLMAVVVLLFVAVLALAAGVIGVIF